MAVLAPSSLVAFSHLPVLLKRSTFRLNSLPFPVRLYSPFCRKRVYTDKSHVPLPYRHRPAHYTTKKHVAPTGDITLALASGGLPEIVSIAVSGNATPQAFFPTEKQGGGSASAGPRKRRRRPLPEASAGLRRTRGLTFTLYAPSVKIRVTPYL